MLTAHECVANERRSNRGEHLENGVDDRLRGRRKCVREKRKRKRSATNRSVQMREVLLFLRLKKNWQRGSYKSSSYE